jgi:hypothetical protein
MEGYLIALSVAVMYQEPAFPHQVLALAIKDLWSDTSRSFAPSPGEFLKAAQRAHSRLCWALTRARHLLAMRQSAEAILEKVTTVFRQEAP